MKKLALLFVIAILLLTSACDTVTYTYELTPIDVTDPYAPMYRGVGEFDTLSMLSDGNIVFREWAMSGGGNIWYRNYIIHPDGYEVRLSDTYYLRTVIETYDGNIFVTDKNGRCFRYTTDTEKAECDYRLYYVKPLDDGRYFAVNDTHMTSYDYAYGVDSGEQPYELYALYRWNGTGFERLTECIYTMISNDNGELVFESDGKTVLTMTPDDIFKRDSDISVYTAAENGLMHVGDKNGKDVLGCEFDLLSDIVNDRAVAVNDGKAHILEITRQ